MEQTTINVNVYSDMGHLEFGCVPKNDSLETLLLNAGIYKIFKQDIEMYFKTIGTSTGRFHRLLPNKSKKRQVILPTSLKQLVVNINYDF